MISAETLQASVPVDLESSIGDNYSSSSIVNRSLLLVVALVVGPGNGASYDFTRRRI